MHVTAAILIAGEVSLKVSAVPDPIFYALCVPGLLIGIPAAMRFGLGGSHSESVCFGILFGLPFNVLAYCFLATFVMKWLFRQEPVPRSTFRRENVRFCQSSPALDGTVCTPSLTSSHSRLPIDRSADQRLVRRMGLGVNSATSPLPDIAPKI